MNWLSVFILVLYAYVGLGQTADTIQFDHQYFVTNGYNPAHYARYIYHIINTENDCGSYASYMLDMNSYNVVDGVNVYEILPDGSRRRIGSMIVGGLCDIQPCFGLCTNGFAHVKGNMNVFNMSFIFPADFGASRTIGPWGSGRLYFSSRQDQILLEFTMNPCDNSILSYYVHPPTFIKDLCVDTIFTEERV